NPSALTDKQSIRGHEHRLGMLAHQCFKREVEIVRSVGLACHKLEWERARCDLNVSPMDRIRLIADIHQHANARRARYHFKRKFHLLPSEAVRYDQYARRLGAWPRKVRRQAETNGIGQ